jgi:hypothetical protein
MSVRSASRTRSGRVDAPAGEPRTRSRNLHDERQPSSAGLAVRYAVTGLVTLLVVAAAAYAGRTMSTEVAIDAAVRATALVGDLAVRPALDDAVLRDDPRAVAALDEVVRSRALTGSLVRVKIWDRSGRILYSDEPRLRGEQFAFSARGLPPLRGDHRGGPAHLDEVRPFPLRRARPARAAPAADRPRPRPPAPAGPASA